MNYFGLYFYKIWQRNSEWHRPVLSKRDGQYQASDFLDSSFNGLKKED